MCTTSPREEVLTITILMGSPYFTPHSSLLTPHSSRRPRQKALYPRDHLRGRQLVQAMAIAFLMPFTAFLMTGDAGGQALQQQYITLALPVTPVGIGALLKAITGRPRSPFDRVSGAVDRYCGGATRGGEMGHGGVRPYITGTGPQ